MSSRDLLQQLLKDVLNLRQYDCFVEELDDYMNHNEVCVSFNDIENLIIDKIEELEDE